MTAVCVRFSSGYFVREVVRLTWATFPQNIHGKDQIQAVEDAAALSTRCPINIAVPDLKERNS